MADSYTQTQLGGIQFTPDNEGVATAAFARVNTDDTAKFWLFKPGAQTLVDKIVFGGASGADLVRNGTGTYELEGDAEVADVLSEGKFRGDGHSTADTLYFAEVRMNGAGDLRLYISNTSGAAADVGGATPLEVTFNLQPYASAEDIIT